MFSNRRVLIAAAILTKVAAGQTQLDLSTQSKSVNFSGAPFTRPVKTGTVQPATCTVGDLFFNTAAPAGQNLYACVAQNTWALETGGGGSPAGNNGDLQRNNNGALGAANLNQSADGSLNASKSITQPAPNAPPYVAGGTTTCDLSRSTVCQLNANGSTTLSVVNPHGSGPYTFVTITDANGPYTITLPASFQGVPPFSPAASTTTVVNCTYDGSATYTCGYTEAPSVLRMMTERSLPAAPSSGIACAPDSAGHMLRCISANGSTFAMAREISGIRKANGAAADTAAAAADVVGLFSGCSGVQYLGADGACHAAAGGGITNTQPFLMPYGSGTAAASFNTTANTLYLFALESQTANQVAKIISSVSGSSHIAWAVYSFNGSSSSLLATGSAVSACGGCFIAQGLSFAFSAGTSYYLALSTDGAVSIGMATSVFNPAPSGSISAVLAGIAANTVSWSGGVPTFPATTGSISAAAIAWPFVVLTY